MEKNKNNIINKNKRSTQVVIVDKFEDNPQLEGKEMQFHKKPGPIKPLGPKNPSRIKRVERRLEKVERRLERIENLLLSFIEEQKKFNKRQEQFNQYVLDVFKRNNLK